MEHRQRAAGLHWRSLQPTADVPHILQLWWAERREEGEGLVVGTQREGLGVGGVEVYKGLRGVRGHLRLYGVDIAFWVCFIFLEVTFCADVGYHN